MFLNLEDNQSVGAVPPVLLCHNLFQLLYEVADAASGNGWFLEAVEMMTQPQKLEVEAVGTGDCIIMILQCNSRHNTSFWGYYWHFASLFDRLG